MTVLIVTRTGDDHCAPRVLDILAARGVDAVRFDTDRFPGDVRITVTGRGPTDGRIVLPDRTVELSEITAMWNRRVTVGGMLPDAMEPAMRHAAIVESRRVLDELLRRLPVPAIDPIEVHERAAGKQLQLAVAAEVGLRVPRTRITNDPDAVRALIAECPSGVVTKMMHAFEVPTAEGPAVMFTSALEEDDVAALDDGLAWCPMTFQEHVPKARELRVTVVGHRMWTAAVDSQAHAGAEVDWRRDGVGLLDRWVPYTLPTIVAERVSRLMQQLGLVYGAIDFIVTPEGEHVFLEVNPGGEYFWLEDHCDFPISAAIAEHLARGDRRGAR